MNIIHFVRIIISYKICNCRICILSDGRLYSSPPGHVHLTCILYLPDDVTIYSVRLWVACDVDHTHYM